jgi:plastocyanin
MLGVLLLAAALASLLFARGRTITTACLSAFDPATPADAAGMAPMANADWFTRHPARPSNTLDAPADSFIALSTSFQHASDPGVIDTVSIFGGQTVLWKWSTGSHTVTSGTGSSDPNSGALFNASLNTASRTFSFKFDSAGTYNFYCVFHEGFNMKGVVVVTGHLAVGPPTAPGSEGFVRAPWPNPSGETFSFRYAVSAPGHVRATVLDAQGRRVATALDDDVPAGTFESRWSGRTSAGTLAPAGAYFLRLEIAGRVQTRRIALVH